MAILNADYSNINYDEMAQDIGLNVKHIPILVASFIQESQPALEKLQDAIEKNDFDAIHRHAHFIKGSAGNLKFDAVYEMSRDVEMAANEKKKDFDYQGHFQAIKEALFTIKG